MNSLYILEKFNNISKLIYSNGGDLEHKCFLEIIEKYKEYSKNNKITMCKFSSNEIYKMHKEKI